jgi:glycosyltransferase involved in cell wall biosynthesis
VPAPLKTEAIVLRSIRYGEADRILHLYTPRHGRLGAIAKGDGVLAHVLIGSDVMVAPGRSPLYDLVTRRTLARGDLFVCASQAIAARLSTLADIQPAAVLTQQYGLEDWVIEHPVLARTYDFVSNRAWVPNSQIPTLLRIFARVRATGSLALVGGGGPLDVEIRELAAEDPRVVPLGKLPHLENVEVVARSAFYVSMTASDGASLSLMEAMAVGAIPIVSDIDPNREWVEDGVNGALVPLDDDLAAAAVIQTLIGRPKAELDEMRRRNREIVGERGSMTRNMARFRDRLGAVLVQRKGVGS